jgi:hypothetical protein
MRVFDNVCLIGGRENGMAAQLQIGVDLILPEAEWGLGHILQKQIHLQQSDQMLEMTQV